MMPSDVNRISFYPELPNQRQQLQNNWTSRSGFKINIVYDKPYWRERGLNGQAITDTEIGVVIDNSPNDEHIGVLLALVDESQIAPDKTVRMKTLVNRLVQLFGEELANPIDYVEMDWSKETYTSGCVTALGTKVLTSYGPALREPFGQVHWAGSETALIWNGYMEGAVRSGQTVADKIYSVMEKS